LILIVPVFQMKYRDYFLVDKKLLFVDFFFRKESKNRVLL